MDSDGANPTGLLIHACESDSTDALLDAFEVVQKGREHEDNDDLIAAFIDKTKNPLGVPALHVAVRHASTDVLGELAVYPIKVDCVDDKGNTLLHAAIQLTETNIRAGEYLSQLFLDAGVPVLYRNSGHFTARGLVDSLTQIRLDRILAHFGSQIPNSTEIADLPLLDAVEAVARIPELAPKGDSDNWNEVQQLAVMASIAKAVRKEEFLTLSQGDLVKEDTDEGNGSDGESD